MHPLVLVLLEPRCQLLNLVILDFESGVLLLLGRIQVELMVLNLSILPLHLRKFALKHLHLVLFHDQLLLVVTEFSLMRVDFVAELVLLVFELSTHLIKVINFILFDGQICLSLVSKLHVVFLKGIKFLMNAGLFFPLNQTLVFVL